MNTIEKTFDVPSNGLFGGPKQITLRAMTTKEEKIILTTKDFSVFERIVKSCCVEPKDLDLGLLHQNDIIYLIFALRELTFGSTYIQEFICPDCGVKSEIEVDIAEMTVNILDTENLDERLTCTLPILGDELQLKILSSGEINRLDRLIKQKVAKNKLKDPDSYEFTLKLMATIVTINGEEMLDEEAKRHYVDTLHLSDLQMIQNTLNEIDFGLDTTLIRTCDNCYNDEEVRGLICPEFFRPSK